MRLVGGRIPERTAVDVAEGATRGVLLDGPGVDGSLAPKREILLTAANRPNKGWHSK